MGKTRTAAVAITAIALSGCMTTVGEMRQKGPSLTVGSRMPAEPTKDCLYTALGNLRQLGLPTGVPSVSQVAGNFVLNYPGSVNQAWIEIAPTAAGGTEVRLFGKWMGAERLIRRCTGAGA
jgi:hypothetical protein